LKAVLKSNLKNAEMPTILESLREIARLARLTLVLEHGDDVGGTRDIIYVFK
jgi:hypothetical protein